MQDGCGVSSTFLQKLHMEAGRLGAEAIKVAALGATVSMTASNLIPSHLRCRPPNGFAGDDDEFCLDQPLAQTLSRGFSVDEEGSDRYQLQVEVLSAAHLGCPEYRIGDSLSAMMGNSLQAYVELSVGGHKLQTKCGEASGRRSKSVCSDGARTGEALVFKDCKQAFPYRGGKELVVTVRDRRNVQSWMRGDPLIGDGTLQLDPGLLLQGSANAVDLAITRGAEPAGKVSLRYQLLDSSGGVVTRPEPPCTSEKKETGRAKWL